MTYTPEVQYVASPGDIIYDILAERSMTQAALARKMRHKRKAINSLVQGRVLLTAPIAEDLEKALGVPSTVWLAWERNYRNGLAQGKKRIA